MKQNKDCHPRNICFKSAVSITNSELFVIPSPFKLLKWIFLRLLLM